MSRKVFEFKEKLFLKTRKSVLWCIFMFSNLYENYDTEEGYHDTIYTSINASTIQHERENILASEIYSITIVHFFISRMINSLRPRDDGNHFSKRWSRTSAYIDDFIASFQYPIYFRLAYFFHFAFFFFLFKLKIKYPWNKITIQNSLSPLYYPPFRHFYR